MSKPRFSIQRYPYDDSAWHMGILVSDGILVGYQDFYVYEKEVRELGTKLAAFPTGSQNEVVFEIGDEHNEKWAHYVRLRFFVRDSSGHTALAIKFIRNGDVMAKAVSEFCQPIDVASLNRLGSSIRDCRWEIEDAVDHELHVS
ncbi:MAG TPA: hypothetical protein VHY30_09245 [Verrucomicrobiae bacterium]|jgi:hypothetical protein|nr:hypothetical protein [Verrucomicrobiae bacterium]